MAGRKSLSRIPQKELKIFLDEMYLKFNTIDFIDNDPVRIPHQYKKTQDIEIAGLFASTLAWGNRKAIIKNTEELLRRMDYSPHAFVMEAGKTELNSLKGFVHRTFNSSDANDFILALRKLYSTADSLEKYFIAEGNALDKIAQFRTHFVKGFKSSHALKHVSDPLKGSAAKRLCMYLRWMVRKDASKVDFGLWKQISPADLILPLDVHTGNVSRKLGLLQRSQDDAKAAIEITEKLKLFDQKDPVKYDYALFGIGVTKMLADH